MDASTCPTSAAASSFAGAAELYKKNMKVSSNGKLFINYIPPTSIARINTKTTEQINAIFIVRLMWLNTSSIKV